MAQKILVAEDRLYLLRLIQHQLEHEGFELIQANDGLAAVEAAVQETPDLAVLDVMMPKMDGLSALRRIRREKKTRAMPVIVLTSSPHDVLREEAKFSGADVVLTKPFSPTQLVEEIRRLLSESAPAEPGLALVEAT